MRGLQIDDVYRSHREFKIQSLNPFRYLWLKTSSQNEEIGGMSLEEVTSWANDGRAVFIRNENKSKYFNKLYEKLQD